MFNNFFSRSQPPAGPQPDPHLVYRLRHWPENCGYHFSSRVLQALSRMSIGPLTERLFVERSGLALAAARELLARLDEEGCLDVIVLGAGPAGAPHKRTTAPLLGIPRVALAA